MVNWNNPQTVLAESFALVKFVHVVDGIYIWEYFTTLWFEWQVLTKRRPWKWSMAIYFAARIFAISGVCTQLVGFNLTSRYNCQAWIDAVLITCYPAFIFNSLLILLRTIAIWERRLILSIALTGVWLTNVGFLIHGMTLGKSVWIPLENACFIEDTQKAKYNVLVSAVTDLILLLSMIIGVLRLESDTSIWRMLYRHGMVWIVLATIGLFPPAIFLFLNLNAPMNLMFQTPALVIMTICSTRLYRSLVTFGHRPMTYDSFLTSAPMASIQPDPRNIRLPLNTPSHGTPSLTTGSGTTGTNVSLEVEFPTSYGRYRAEDLELENDRLKAIHEEGEDCGNDKANAVC
ncbi:hypothetical protein EI94DRAFT_1750788 [Lactarius quietus]|nr:hypothetical protein EI94DRAFT_1750788 [Lactarius quietus]